MPIDNINNVPGAGGVQPTRPTPDQQRVDRSEASRQEAEAARTGSGTVAQDSFQATDTGSVRELAETAGATEPTPRIDMVMRAKNRVSEGYYDLPEIRRMTAEGLSDTLIPE